MRFLIAGAGSMGMTVGWALQGGGHDVAFYVRPGSTMRHPYLLDLTNVRGRRGAFTHYSAFLKPNYVENFSPEKPWDAILVFVRHFDLPALLDLLSKKTQGIPVVIFGNLWDDYEAHDLALSGRRLFGFFHFGASLVGSDLHCALRTAMSLGEAGPEMTPRLEALMKAFADSGFKPRHQPRMREWMTTHFAFNCGFISAAIAAGGLGRLLRSPKHILLAQALMREAFAVCKARGANPEHFPGETGLSKMPGLLAVPMMMAMGLTPAMRMAVRHNHADGRELKSYFLDLTKTAKSLGVLTPRLESLRPIIEEFPDSYRVEGPLKTGTTLA